MKARVLLIGAVAIVGTGVAMHTTGGKPKCPLQMLMHPKKSEPKPNTAVVDPVRAAHVQGSVVSEALVLEKTELAHK